MDTIFALSSAPGRAGVAVIRISGAKAASILCAFMQSGQTPPARKAHLTRLYDNNGKVMDEALVLFFPAPNSFTGEDVVELHVHASRAVLSIVFQALAHFPETRPAQAGEFTRRAFDNDKLDLAEVEGLGDLIEAETQAQHQLALAQMRGSLSNTIEAWNTNLMRALAYLEAILDFPDEDLPEDVDSQISRSLNELIKEMQEVLSSAHTGERIREGLHVAIIGAPNAGKSSLLNLLAKRDAAIVADVAGTTRDVIEVQMDIGGYAVTLCDTAGLRDEQRYSGVDAVEREGIRRSHATAEKADLKIAVFDASQWPQIDSLTTEFFDEKTIILFNKADLLNADQRASISANHGLPSTPLLMSCSNQSGIGELVSCLSQLLSKVLEAGQGSPLLTRARHRHAVEDAVQALKRAQTAQLLEIRAEELRQAAHALGRIVGRFDVENLLDIVFRDFCIGK